MLLGSPLGNYWGWAAPPKITVCWGCQLSLGLFMSIKTLGTVKSSANVFSNVLKGFSLMSFPVIYQVFWFPDIIDVYISYIQNYYQQIIQNKNQLECQAVTETRGSPGTQPSLSRSLYPLSFFIFRVLFCILFIFFPLYPRESERSQVLKLLEFFIDMSGKAFHSLLLRHLPHSPLIPYFNVRSPYIIKLHSPLFVFCPLLCPWVCCLGDNTAEDHRAESLTPPEHPQAWLRLYIHCTHKLALGTNQGLLAKY